MIFKSTIICLRENILEFQIDWEDESIGKIISLQINLDYLKSCFFSDFYYSYDKIYCDKINNNMNMWQESLEKSSSCSLIFTKN